MSKIKNFLKRVLTPSQMQARASDVQIDANECTCKCVECAVGCCFGCTRGGFSLNCKRWSNPTSYAGKGVGLLPGFVHPDTKLARMAEQRQIEERLAWSRLQARANAPPH